MERNTRSKAEQEYVKSLIHNLSLQRMTDQEISDYLHQKGIEIARTTVNTTRNRIERSAEKWYIELRNSAYKYLAQYKQRIDSLLSYQRTLHEIISNTNKDEVKIRAISELHSIEMDILSLWKQLPDSNIVNTVDNTENERGKGKKVPWVVQIGGEEVAEAEAEADEGGSEKEPEFWTVDPKPDPPNPPTEQEIQPQEEENISIATQMCNIALSEEEPEQKPNDVVDIDILGRFLKPFDVEPWVQCNFNSLGKDCNRWFKTKEIRSKHIAKYHT